MSVEAEPRTSQEKSVSTSVEDLEAMMNTGVESEAATEADTIENRELSPTASKLDRLSGTISRIADRLNSRARNKAHSEAIKEDTFRTETAQDESYDSYSDNIAVTKDRERGEKREAREAQIDNAKTFLKKTGRSAVEAAIKGGEIAVGIGYIAGETVINKTVQAAETGKDLAETAALKAMYAADTARDKIETAALGAMYAVDQGREAIEGTIDTLLQKLTEKAKVAMDRRDARRARWSARKDALVGRSREALDSTQEKGRDALGRAHAARAAGSAALAAVMSARSAARTTYAKHLDQNNL